MWSVSADPVDFDEAIAWFRKRVKLTPDEWRALEDRAKAKAFTVANVAQLDLVDHAWQGIDDAIAKGTTLDDFKKSIGETLKAAWGADVSNPAWRLETIFRTNVQLSYSAGRYRQAMHPDVLEHHPLWMFDAVLDGRTSPICAACNGTKLLASDAWWNDHTPPLHFNCRSTITTMADDGDHSEPPDVPAASGFGSAPTDDGEGDWEPDLSEYPDELRHIYEGK